MADLMYGECMAAAVGLDHGRPNTWVCPTDAAYVIPQAR
jgi:hypothetical protein